jgi:probable F420-dependent oxidoreductase
MTQPFRFAVHLPQSPEGTAAGWAAQARQIENLGYSTLQVPDHFDNQLAPMPALAAAAAATDHLHIGALVFDNDYRHPVLLAQEAATVDVLSEGRLELSLGAGWKRTDYQRAGIPYDPPATRVDRFEEAVTVIKGLLSTDGPYSFAGSHYKITSHTLLPRPVQHPRPPLVVGGGGRRMLSIAGREAEIVSVMVNMGAGTSETVGRDATPDRTRQKVAWVREAAGARFDKIELHTLIHYVEITNDPIGACIALSGRLGVDWAEVPHMPLVLVGTLEQMAEELEWRRAEYGFSYYTVQSSQWAALGPLVVRMTGT